MFGTFTLVFAALSGLGTFGAVGLAQQLRSGQAEILEGQVTDFSSGGKSECFSVESQHSATRTSLSGLASTGCMTLVVRCSRACRSEFR